MNEFSFLVPDGSPSACQIGFSGESEAVHSFDLNGGPRQYFRLLPGAPILFQEDGSGTLDLGPGRFAMIAESESAYSIAEWVSGVNPALISGLKVRQVAFPDDAWFKGFLSFDAAFVGIKVTNGVGLRVTSYALVDRAPSTVKAGEFHNIYNILE